MDRVIEDRLVAMLEAVGAPLPRREIYSRVDEDFESEEELAMTLGRLVASGRLVRAMRPRFNKADEAVYSAPKTERLAAIAAAAEQLGEAELAASDGRELLRTIDNETPALAPPPAPPEKENDMKRRTPAEVREAVIEALRGEALSKADVAERTKLSPSVIHRTLAKLADEDLVTSSGKGRGTRYAIGAPAPGQAPAGKPAKPSAPAAAAPVATGDCVFAIESTGTLAISSPDGKERTRIESQDVIALAHFLEVTESIWKRAIIT